MTRSYSDRQRTLQWVLPTTLRVYGLRPSGKTKGSTASFLKASLSTNCVLLENQLANGLHPSFAQASCKECAALRQAARSALRSAGRKGSTLKCEPATPLRVYCFAVSRLER